MGELRLVNDEDLRRAAADAARAAVVQAAAISRALDERGAAAPAGGRLLPEAIEVRAHTAAERLRRRVEEMAERARDRAHPCDTPAADDAGAAADGSDAAPQDDAPEADAPQEHAPQDDAPGGAGSPA